MRNALVLAGLLGLVGCKKEKPASPPVPGPTGPTSTAEQDALWKMAPEGAMVGMVVSPRGMKMLDGAASAVYQFLGSSPELAAANTRVTSDLQKALGTAHPLLADVGLSHDKGAAMFFFESKGSGVLVLPVTDRDKFLAATHGKKGTDTDTIDTMTCKTQQGFYTCAEPAALLDKLGKADLKPTLATVGARGDIEFAAHGPIAGGQLDVATVVQMSSGAFVVRGAVAGVPQEAMKYFSDGGKARVDGATSGFGVIDPRPFFANVPAQPLPGGITLKDITNSVAGPITGTIAGDGTAEARVPLSDPKPVQTLLEHCGELSPVTSFANGVCHATIPQLATIIDVWVDGKELHIGKKDAPAGKGGVALGGAAQELASTPWSFAFYGRGSLIGMPQIPGMSSVPMPDEAAAALGGMALINELGIGVRKDGNALRFLMTVRTAFANPDDVVKKLLAIPSRDVFTGKSVDAAKAIADASPQSPFAADLHAGYGGTMAPAAMVGIMAAVAVPAFMEYMKKSKKSEASLELNKIAKAAKAYAAQNGAFPKGTVQPASQSCCGQPENKCQANAATWKDPVWQALDFQIDEPAMYQYGYTSTDGKTFHATAVADLDCDGTPATWMLDGTIGADGNSDTTLTPPPKGVY